MSRFEPRSTDSESVVLTATPTSHPCGWCLHHTSILFIHSLTHFRTHKQTIICTYVWTDMYVYIFILCIYMKLRMYSYIDTLVCQYISQSHISISDAPSLSHLCDNILWLHDPYLLPANKLGRPICERAFICSYRHISNANSHALGLLVPPSRPPRSYSTRMGHTMSTSMRLFLVQKSSVEWLIS